MSLALQSNGGDTIRRQRFIHGMPCMSIYDSSDPKTFAGDRRIEPDMESCSSSSLGRNSDVSDESSNGEDSADDEVQSSFKGPLDTMDGLEEVLPIKRGISKFYNGKSKSFTSLSDATSVSSIKDFAKPENPYTRKRKNLIARSSLFDKNRTYSLKDLGSGTSKRTASSSRSSFLLGEASNNSGNNEDLSSISTSPSCSRPPLHPHVKPSTTNGSSSPPQRQSPWRSFSLSDLQSVAAAAAASTANLRDLAISSGGKDK